MSFCRWVNENTLDIYTKERECRVVFPEYSDRAPVLSFAGRYLAIDTGKNLYIREFQENRLFCLKKNVASEIRFDRINRLFYTERNDIRVLDIPTMQDNLVYHVGRTPHGPKNIGVSPNGNYVSFCRNIGDTLRLFAFNAKTNTLIDPKLEIAHYSWLDHEHIVWSNGCVLKLLDITTGKNKQLVRGFRSLMRQGFDEIFAPFETIKCGIPIQLDFLRVLNGRVYFLLAVGSSDFAHRHLGLWSLDSEDFTAQFHYSVPFGCSEAEEKYVADNEKIVWKADEWHVFDGTAEETCSNDWRWIIRFGERNV